MAELIADPVTAPGCADPELAHLGRAASPGSLVRGAGSVARGAGSVPGLVADCQQVQAAISVLNPTITALRHQLTTGTGTGTFPSTAAATAGAGLDTVGLVESLAMLDAAFSALSLARTEVSTMVRESAAWAHGPGAVGVKDYTQWRAASTRAGVGAVRGEERDGAALTLLPRLREAATTGDVTAGHISAVGTVLANVSEHVREELKLSSISR